MLRMRLRWRDARAILFCVTTVVLLAGLVIEWMPNPVVDAAIVVAYVLFLLSRPRMKRVMARLRDEPSWRGYFRN
jgi:hypothetical protein